MIHLIVMAFVVRIVQFGERSMTFMVNDFIPHAYQIYIVYVRAFIAGITEMVLASSAVFTHLVYISINWC